MVTTTFGYEAMAISPQVQEPGPDNPNDPNGNPLMLTTLLGYTGGIGLPTTITDNLGNVTTNSYDARGNLLISTDANGFVTTNQYNLADQLLDTHITQQGNLVSEDAGSYRFPGGYLDQENLTYPAGASAETDNYSYGPAGELLATSSTTGAAVERMTYSYDPLYRVWTMTDPSGHVTQYKYGNPGGRFSQALYPDGRTVSITGYDGGQRVTNWT